MCVFLYFFLLFFFTEKKVYCRRGEGRAALPREAESRLPPCPSSLFYVFSFGIIVSFSICLILCIAIFFYIVTYIDYVCVLYNGRIWTHTIAAVFLSRGDER